jgi:solute:Na+ symporter, SSS family
MGISTCMAFLPYMVIQFKGAGLVMHAVTGWSPTVGAIVVYAVVTTYVIVGGVRGVGWTNVLQGLAMVIVVWFLGVWVPTTLYGGIEAMFDRLIVEKPEHLTLPGPGPTTSWQYSSEILVSILGFSMWPQVFMKCFTARSARLVQLSAVLYPTFLFFLVPLVFLGYAAVLEGGPADDTVLLWLLRHPDLAASTMVFGFVAFAVLAASMSTGDALLHAGGSILVRDVLVGALGVRLDDRVQTRVMRGVIVAMGIAAVVVLEVAGDTSVVDLLLLAYAIPIQFLPLTLLGLYWRRANGTGARWGLCTGLATVVILFTSKQLAPGLHDLLNPADLQIGVVGGAVNLLVLVVMSLATRPPDRDLLHRFELRDAP